MKRIGNPLARKISPLVFLPPVMFLGLAVLFYFGLNRTDPDALPTALKGQMAPELVVEALGSNPLVMPEDFATPGVKLVNFWASWCAPCRAEHGTLEKLAAEGMVIHGINYKDSPENALGFLDELGNPFAKLASDQSGRTGLNWGLYGVPETFVLDSKGRIILRHAGPLTRRVLEATILPAIAAAE